MQRKALPITISQYIESSLLACKYPQKALIIASRQFNGKTDTVHITAKRCTSFPVDVIGKVDRFFRSMAQRTTMHKMLTITICGYEKYPITVATNCVTNSPSTMPTSWVTFLFLYKMFPSVLVFAIMLIRNEWNNSGSRANCRNVCCIMVMAIRDPKLFRKTH